jgi:hypothetical protein
VEVGGNKKERQAKQAKDKRIKKREEEAGRKTKGRCGGRPVKNRWRAGTGKVTRKQEAVRS